MATERKRGAEMRRIDDDEYRFCVTCGEDIPAERLEIDPTIATCIRCASGSAR
ncbi:MAG TPA: TraR/DksA C4-type zinc finger protein [Alphaproteobacteria bacterium]|nr:TraR/DksA C4-type zinc finger protein [Alphaproteobacteria bacterium]